MGLQLEQVTKAFGAKIAVDRLSLSMNAPGVFGLIGTNGAGKTTTIRMTLGIMPPDAGKITWNGQPITRESVRFGYMPEERGIYMKNKVLDQLVYFGMLRGMTRSDAAASATRYMEMLGLTEYRDMAAEKLSKGNQQKVQLAATLIHDPELIFLDEPFSGLDPVNTEVLRTLIHDLVAEGKYIIMSSHQMATVEEYSDNLLILNRGKTVLSGNLREIKAGYGNTNLIVSADGDYHAIAESCGMQMLDETPVYTEYKITGDDMAKRFLDALLSAGIYPLRYEIRQPSLHEIFLEKVGDAQ